MQYKKKGISKQKVKQNHHNKKKSQNQNKFSKNCKVLLLLRTRNQRRG
jgi:hypothetical protein